MKIKPGQVALSAGALVLIAAVLWAYRSFSLPRREVAAYRRDLLAKGEKLTVEELLPPALLFEKNSVAIFNQARMYRSLRETLLDTNSPSAMQMVAPGKALIRWAQPEIRNRTTNTWEEAEAVLAQDQQAFQLLEAIIERPALDFHLDYRQGFDLMLPHLSALRQAANRLSDAAVCDLRDGDTDAAASKVRTILAITKGMGDERLWISQLVRIAISQIALAATWELLQSPGTTGEQLATLQTDWAGLGFSIAVENALLMERALAEMTLNRMRNSSVSFRHVANGWSGAADDFDGDGAGEASVGGEVDRAHAAFAEFAIDAIRAEHSAGGEFRFDEDVGQQIGSDRLDGGFERGGLPLVVLKQRLKLAEEIEIASTGAVQEGAAIRGRERECVV
ncbi:MAG: hypothetical protein QOJ40_3104, partial [Verrucomicrobiota bacterium]